MLNQRYNLMGLLMRFTFSPESHDGWTHALQQEWLETNGLGGYASSSLVGCNTRKYHGLFVANLPDQADRHVLLSTLEETLICEKGIYPLSSRQHPGVYHPKGHEYITEVKTFPFIETTYQYDSLIISRAMLWLHETHTLLIRYRFQNIPPAAQFSITPLLAYRSFHTLTHENSAVHSLVEIIDYGITVQPYMSLPKLFIQSFAPRSPFVSQPDWCRDVLYFQEENRGFPASEDLFMPGQFVFSPLQGDLYLAIGLEPFSYNKEASSQSVSDAWNNEVARRQNVTRLYPTKIQANLAKAAERFIVHQPHVGASILAGYHWFNAWGRDSFIALPGLCFCTEHHELGKKILVQTCAHAKNGLVPNILSPDGDHAYNSVDASLWYIWAVQQMTRYVRESSPFIKEALWPFLKEIIRAYAKNAESSVLLSASSPLETSPKVTSLPCTPSVAPNSAQAQTSTGVPFTSIDSEGFLKVGTPETQLTWMDAMAYGKAVTPRHGYAVEMNALWYNALVFVNELAEQFGESPIVCPKMLKAMPEIFLKRFWVNSPEDCYLADLWDETERSLAIRPNQIFAIAMPNSLVKDPQKAQSVVKTVTKHLLTPYGLRTLSPTDEAYCPRYEGGPNERDSAYHQGTVWPWLLGAYAEALIQTSHNKEQDVNDFLTTISPLFQCHLHEAGIGSISEIFDASAPHRPNGCIAQAWSVAEILRLMETINSSYPGLLEHHVSQQGKPDTLGRPDGKKP